MQLWTWACIVSNLVTKKSLLCFLILAWSCNSTVWSCHHIFSVSWSCRLEHDYAKYLLPLDDNHALLPLTAGNLLWPRYGPKYVLHHVELSMSLCGSLNLLKILYWKRWDNKLHVSPFIYLTKLQRYCKLHISNSIKTT